MKTKELAVSERPRERLLAVGASKLSNTELLALILKTGTKDLDVKSLANNILKSINDITFLKHITYNKLVNIKGLGIAKASSLIAALELGKRVYYQSAYLKKIRYNNPKKIYEDNKYLFAFKKQECFYCLYLNSQKELIEKKLLFMGTNNQSLVHPREIFREAYLLSASSIICMHNHPSGDITPSKEDIRLTNALIEIGTLQQIPVLDHIIFGNNTYFSFHDHKIC